jgi:hypothetical protein
MPLLLKPVAEFTAAELAAVLALRGAVYPPDVPAANPARHLQRALPESGVIVTDDQGRVVSFVGMLVRAGSHDGAPRRIGGIGSVSTHPTAQRRGHATAALRLAMESLREDQRVDFSLLLCRDALLPFYGRLGWTRFPGELRVDQPGGPITFTVSRTMVLPGIGPAPGGGVIDLNGLPW